MDSVAPRLLIPDAPAVVAGPRHVAVVEADGEIATLDLATAVRRLAGRPLLVCHAPALARRLGLAAGRLESYDVLELFAFVCPAHFCLPTPRGVALAVGLARPADLEDEVEALLRTARLLLEELAESQASANAARATRTRNLAWTMAESMRTVSKSSTRPVLR